MTSALFGASGSSRSKNLVEFKAGKMTLKGKMVHPDKRKGLVYVYQSDDSLMHFCWKDRTSGVVEDDLMIFPDDIETRKVAQCTTGRVFLMKFKSSNKKFFFWMQEPESDKDEKLWRKLNECLNNPPAPGSSSSSASIGDRGGVSSAAAGLASAFGGADFGGLGGSDLQSLLGSMSEQQLQMFLGGLMPVSPSSNRSGSSSLSSNQTSRVQSTTPGSRAEPSSSTSNNPALTTSATTQNVSATPATAASKPAGESEAKPVKEEPGSPGNSQKIQFSDLQSILGNLATGSERSELDLSEIVTLDVMAPILANKNIQEKLIQYLPDSDILPKTEQELRTTLTTPQFKKAMSSFGSALQSGQLGPLMKQFDLPESVTLAAAQGNLQAFAAAMEAYSKSKKSVWQRRRRQSNGHKINKIIILVDRFF